MMKGTPCSSRDCASLKTLGKLSYSHRSGNPAKRVRAWVRFDPFAFAGGNDRNLREADGCRLSPDGVDVPPDGIEVCQAGDVA